MEGVLHVEPIVRYVKPPLTIGYTDYIYYGEKPVGEDEDSLGDPAVFMQLGCPLESVDMGSNNTVIPLVKTIECMSDPDRNRGMIYLESIHYLKDSKFLIPVRTKIHSGRSEGLRISHIPSLNFARYELSGDGRKVNDVRCEMISSLVDHDRHFVENHRHPINEWIKDDLVNTLETSPVTDIRFDTKRLYRTIDAFVDEVRRVPYEMGDTHLKRVLNKISVENETIPVSYFSEDVICRPVSSIRHRLLPVDCNFKSFGRLPIENIPNLEVNPLQFQDILGIIDRLALTDCNVDVVVQVDNSISFIKNHIAVNRLAVFSDNDLTAFSQETLLYDIVNERTLQIILEKFSKHHSAVSGNGEMLDILNTEPIKLKIIKTINDEALILLYRFNSKSTDSPLCGVYFDIAVQSLAPLTIIPESKLY